MTDFAKDFKEKFQDRFNWLQLYEVTYDTANNLCSVIFLFPETKDYLNDDERQEIHDFFVSELSLYSKIEIKYRKSFLDADLLIKELFSFLKSSYKAIAVNMESEHISVNKDRDIIIMSIRLERTAYNYFCKNELQDTITKHMEKNFIASFDTEFILDENLIVDTSSIDIRIKAMENEANLVVKPKVERYDVGDTFRLIGSDIIPKPEYIKPLTSEKSRVILSGVISNFTKREFVRKKNKKLGEDAPKNAWYTFVLSDTSGRISCSFFSSKVNEKKMDKLTDGARILTVGDTRFYNGKLSYSVREISFCSQPIIVKNEEPIKKQQVIVDTTKYVYVLPKVFKQELQSNLFDRPTKYNDNIMQNNFIVYDFETTGLEPDKNEIIEIGACKVVQGQITETFSSLVKNIEPIPNIITNLTGIDDSMTINAPSIEKVLRDFKVFCGDYVMVGYNNIMFDAKFLTNQASLCQLIFENEQQDALLLARAKLRLKNYKLGNVVKNLQLVLVDAHRALNDVIATAKVFLKLNEI